MSNDLHLSLPEKLRNVIQFPGYFIEYFLGQEMIKLLGGPRNSGKTFAFLHGYIILAALAPVFRGERRTRILISRSTIEEATNSMVSEFNDAFPAEFWFKRLSGKAPIRGEMRWRGDDGIPVSLEIVMISLNLDEDKRKLKSVPTTFGHIVEAQTMQCGELIHHFARAIGPKGRYPTNLDYPGHPYACLMMDCNYPSQGHWLHRKFVNPETRGDQDVMKLYRVPPAMNFIPAADQTSEGPEAEYMFRGEYGTWETNPDADFCQILERTGMPMNKVGYEYYIQAIKENPGDARLLEDVIGDFHPDTGGVPVFPRFSRIRNVPAGLPEPDRSKELIVSFDLETYPAFVIAQMNDMGGINVYESFFEDQYFFEPMFKEKFWPLYKDKYRHWAGNTVFLSDMRNKKDGNRGFSPVSIAAEYGIKLQHMGTDKTEDRLEALGKFVNWDGMLQISRKAEHLILAMEGNYRRESKRDGSIKIKPEKDEWSHEPDCLENIALYLLAPTEKKDFKTRKVKHKFK